jgi:hypothetical protein
VGTTGIVGTAVGTGVFVATAGVVGVAVAAPGGGVDVGITIGGIVGTPIGIVGRVGGVYPRIIGDLRAPSPAIPNANNKNTAKNARFQYPSIFIKKVYRI